ncbi:MAG TPA: nitronate monooxygenase [Streptosporangiaceae bacterium]|nr:nitronate monooxygenase [Streptosporangiaceae bacterium]
MREAEGPQGERSPVVVAPMAGGVSTPELVVAAAQAGALGFVAAGYKSAVAMREQIDAVQAVTSAPFGVNVFVPGGPAQDAGALQAYLEALADDARQLDAELGDAAWDDDDWAAKVVDLVNCPVPVVSFTFGCPPLDLVATLRDRGSRVWVTVTDEAEAAQVAEVGPDCLIVQGSEAGAHRGTFANGPDWPDGRGTIELVEAVRKVTSLPLIAAGGIMTAEAVEEALAAGAAAVQCGTAFLRCPQSGASPVHKAALADPRFDRTGVTRAFSGRPARGLVNGFMRAHEAVPSAYPEINNATRPLRAAAAAAGDADRMSLWAGEGFRLASAQPVAEVVERLCGNLAVRSSANKV